MSDTLFTRDPADGKVKKFEIAKDDKTADVTVKIENQTELEKDLLWDEMRQGIVEKYKEKGIAFDANTLQSKADLDNAAQILLDMDKRATQENTYWDKGVRGGDTVNYYSEGQQTGKTTYQLDENSNIDLDWAKFDSTEDMILILNKQAKKNDPQAIKALNQLTKKMLHNSKPIDWEYNGKLKSLITAGTPILESDPENVKIAKEKRNEAVRKDRCNWRILSSYE
jgi:hypothetical protein